MSQANTILLGTAFTIGLVHTLIGVDHTLPFILLARSQRWSLRKLWLVTGLCGVAHVLSSVVIGALGIALGIAVDRLAWLETSRGNLAARLLIGFGLAYMVWGFYRSRRRHRHDHAHLHGDGTVHQHEHDHAEEHVHVHADAMSSSAKTVTVLSLFVVFVLGPCEALIPMVVAPSLEKKWLTVLGVVAVFGAATVGAMLVVVTAGWYGMRWKGLKPLERYMHALAGLAIASSGLAIELLGI